MFYSVPKTKYDKALNIYVRSDGFFSHDDETFKRGWAFNAGKKTPRYYYLTNKIQGKQFYVHRLVAKHFCENPSSDFYVVDHIDGNSKNNDSSNLRWVSPTLNSLNRKSRNTFKNWRSKQYQGCVQCMGVKHYTKQFKCETDAYHAVVELKAELFDKIYMGSIKNETPVTEHCRNIFGPQPITNGAYFDHTSTRRGSCVY